MNKCRLLASCVPALLVSAAMLCCCRGVIAAEYRGIAVTGFSNGFANQSLVNTLLGVVGDSNSKGEIRNANCNSVFVEVRRSADVCYPSGLGEPYFSGLSPSNFNALKAIIDAAHDTTGGKKRIEVDAWVVAFRTDGNSVYAAHSDPMNPSNYWTNLNDTGAVPGGQAFDPGHPNAEEYITNVCMDLVNNFGIDGITFDYIRYTGPTEGYNPTSVARFNARYNRTGQPDAGDEMFKKWRRDQITALVRKVYAKIQASKPGVKLSVFGPSGSPAPTASTNDAFSACQAYDKYYCDWDSWVQEGIVDMSVPMTYFDKAGYASAYTGWLKFDGERQGNRMIVPAPGVYLNYMQDAIDQVKEAENASPHVGGFVAYSYQSPYSVIKDGDPGGPQYGSWSTFKTQLLSQVTTTWQDIPTMTWKTSPSKGHIGGTITCAPGAVWADGAQVRISGPENRQMRCDGTGFYAFIDLSPGTYTIKTNYGTYEDAKTVTVNAVPGITNGDIYAHTTDVTAPVVSSVQVDSVSDSSVVITWNTDEISCSQVEYDSAPYYGQSTAQDPMLTTEHSVTLQGLTPSTAYHFRVKSVNGAGLAGYSTDYNFTTSPVQTTTTVDETDSNCALSGSWILSTYTTGNNGNYHYIGSTHPGTATWTPSLPRTGPYDVVAYYVQGSNRCTKALYTVNYSGGSKQTTVNQRDVAGTGWNVSLGTGLQFDMGSSANVVLSNPSADGNVIADAVRFIYKGDVTAPVMTGCSAVSTQSYVTSTTTLQASWSGYDNESGITKYRYAVGSLPGMSDVKAWTDAGTAAAVTITGLSLQYNHTYYISARAVNGAGLTSDPFNSTGVTVARIVADSSEGKAYADGDVISMSAAIVTGGFGDRFYVEDQNRITGLRVESSISVAPKQKVQVFGTLGVANGCERSLMNCKVVTGAIGPEEIKPVAVISKSLGGSGLAGRSPGITGGIGLNNVGLLVRIAGRVTRVVSDGFYVDDGSKMTDETGYAGVKVWTGAPGSATQGALLKVTGVVSCRQALSGVVYPQVLKRDIN